jgi:hypothetical protein
MFWHRVAFASYFIRALASKDTIAQSAELRCDLNVQPRLVCDDINAKGLYEVVSILYGAQLTVAVGWQLCRQLPIGSTCAVYLT